MQRMRRFACDLVCAPSSPTHQKPPTPQCLLVDVFICNVDPANEAFYSGAGLMKSLKTYRPYEVHFLNGTGEWEELVYTGVEQPPEKTDELSGTLKPGMHLKAEGIKLHEGFKFEAGRKYKISARRMMTFLDPSIVNDEDMESIQVQL